LALEVVFIIEKISARLSIMKSKKSRKYISYPFKRVPSLIELMIVLAIIGVLAAIATPQFIRLVMESQGVEIYQEPLNKDGKNTVIGKALFESPNSLLKQNTARINLIVDIKKDKRYRLHSSLQSADFNIIAETPSTQAAGSNSYTRWSWIISPKSKGNKEISATLSELISIEDKETPLVLLRLVRDINVYEFTRHTIWYFCKENVSWLWAPIAATCSIIIWLFLKIWHYVFPPIPEDENE
jgi:prepilin-type N-terminal cleavage/methylation domain-containing protein